MFCHIFPASSKTVLFQDCLSLPLLLASCGFQANACFFNVFLSLPHSMTAPSPFSNPNSQYYRLLCNSLPQLGVACYLRPSYAHYSLQIVTAITVTFICINPLKTKRICFILGLSAYRAVNTLHLGYKNQSLNVL
jgi:hypothetical protein